MSKLTIEVSSELKEFLDRYPKTQWEPVAEKALWQFASKLRLADQLASRSKLTESTAASIGRTVKTGLRRRYARSGR
ncbi:MAG: hypothetical protein HZB35_00885 [Nitrospirae bacterium]|nr:hypothetical protein [Nitrospirota bacterium]